MASLGHIAVGMAASRFDRPNDAPRWSSMAWWSALSLLPDADVVGFSLGVNYGDPWGHRGATHSFTFSVVVGLAVGLAARWWRLPGLKRPGRAALIAIVVLASHAILDTMTDGGLGCALFWPFDLTRVLRPLASDSGRPDRSGLLLPLRRHHRVDGTGSVQSSAAVCAQVAEG